MDTNILKPIPLPSHDMIWLGFLYFTTSCAHLIWRATIYNFGLDEYNVSTEEISLLFSMAAIPGILTMVVGFVAQRIAILGVLIGSYLMIGAGLIVIGESVSWGMVWGGVLLISFGVTIIFPLTNYFCLNRSHAGRAAVRLGKLKSLGPAAAFASIPLIAYILPLLSVRTFFSLAGGLMIVVGIMVPTFARHFVILRQLQGRFQFHHRLIPFYTLNFLNGSRSALFKTFVIFFLVENYNLEIGSTATIVICGYGFNCMGHLLIGPFVQSFGHRKVLQYVYFSVAMLFLGFSIIQAKAVLVLLYMADSFLFCTSVVTDAHLKLTCAKKDYVGQLSAGVSVFYLAGFVMPVIGTMLWRYFDYPGPFVLGAVLALISIMVSQWLKPDSEASLQQ